MPLLFLTFIAILQWLVIQLPGVHPEYDATTFLYGNLQIIIILYVYRTVKKYVKFD